MKFLLEKDLLEVSPRNTTFKNPRSRKPNNQNITTQNTTEKETTTQDNVEKEETKTNNQNQQPQEQEIKESNIAKAKEELEANSKYSYDKLSGFARDKFVKKVLDSVPNKKALKNTQPYIIELIKESNWDNDLLQYLDSIPKNATVTADVPYLVYDLLKSDKINWKDDGSWLTNETLYNRTVPDQLETIKALAFAKHPEIFQQDPKTKENLYFANNDPFTLKDIIKDNEILPLDQIKDIMDSKQKKPADFSSQKELKKRQEEIREIIKTDTKATDNDIDKALKDLEEKVKSESKQALMSLGYSQSQAESAINSCFANEKAAEDLVHKILKYRANEIK